MGPLGRLVRIRFCVVLALIIWLNSDQKACRSVTGDLHGQFDDLLRIFQLLGHPPDTKYLFLGNYVSRGLWSIEIVCLLLAYKLKYPHSIHLLRGPHETSAISRVYGFYGECKFSTSGTGSHSIKQKSLLHFTNS